ncbi:MAG: protein kinase [Myxococcales bacterium]|nr:protein kinase [Myxococcales bacterium]
MSNPGQTLGRYELIARIGEGGMAEVYLARQRGPKAFEKLVVVKTVHSRLAAKPALAEALLEEARIAAKVRHPHVVDIYDLGEEDGTYFIAMEYLEGESMTAIIRAQRAKGGVRLSPLRTAQVVSDCAGGLHAAHELRALSGEPLELVHQDVTPGNVFVLYTGQAKLLDFGVAKVRSSDDASLVKGKAGYLAPELFDKHPADRRSDVFALGVVLWESLTLRRLFAGATDADTFAKIRACVVPAPSSLMPGLPAELDAICARALTKDRDARYPSAKAMQDELNALLRGAERNDYEAMATYMRSTFASQIAARHQLLRELDQGGVPAARTLEALTATFDDRSPATPEPGREREREPEATPVPAPAKLAVDHKAHGKAKLAPLPSLKRPDPKPLPSVGKPATAASAEPAPGAAAEPAVEAGAATASVPSAPSARSKAETGDVTLPGPNPATPATAAASDAGEGGEGGAGGDAIDDPSGLIEVPSGVVDVPPTPAPPPVPRGLPLRPPTGEEITASGEVAPAPGDSAEDSEIQVTPAAGDDDPVAWNQPAGASRRLWIGAGVGAAALIALFAVLMHNRGGASSAARAGGVDDRVAAVTVDAAVEAVGGPAVELDAGVAMTPDPIDAGAAIVVDAAVAVAHVDPIDAGPRDPGAGSAPRGPDPDKAAALSQAGLKKVMGGDANGAIASFQAALRADRSYAPAQRGLGLAYEKKGDKARAARAFREYLALAPNARDAAQIRARLEKLK